MNWCPRPSLAVLSLFLLLASASGAAEKQAANSADVPVFRTSTRVVLVDVVATDSSGKPIHGLQAQDFQIFDSGKRQRVRSFDEHTSEKTPASPVESQPVLAPGVYSNWSPKPASGAVNIILFDTLNLDFTDQVYARMKMVEYLKTLPAGQQVALFTLGDHLRLVQGFTGSTDTLIAAAKKLGALDRFKTEKSESSISALKSLGSPMTPQPPPDAPQMQMQTAPQARAQIGSDSLMPSVHTPDSALQDFLTEDVKSMGDMRTRITLEAFRDLARSLGPIPGRKNLVWISGDFPPLFGSFTERSGMRLFDRELRTTAAVLAAHQVAVYPVDARGLVAESLGNASTSGRELLGDADQGQTPYSLALNDLHRGLQATHNAMDEVAEQTGGRAFYNNNDLSGAIEKTIDSGSNYYTLSYSPANKNWDGQLRSIEVKVGRQNVKLTYRRGYYAVADPFAPVLNIKTTKVDVQKRLIEAVQPNSPQAPAILMKAKAVANGADKPVEIDYVIDPRDLTLAPAENGERAVRYQFVAVAWDEKDNNAGQAWEMVDKEINSQAAAEILRDGINSHRFLTLKPGNYRLYLGVIDLESKKIGTLVIPLKIPKEVAALR